MKNKYLTLSQHLEECEKLYIELLCRKFSHKRVCYILNIERTTLYRKRKKFGLRIGTKPIKKVPTIKDLSPSEASLKSPELILQPHYQNQFVEQPQSNP